MPEEGSTCNVCVWSPSLFWCFLGQCATICLGVFPPNRTNLNAKIHSPLNNTTPLCRSIMACMCVWAKSFLCYRILHIIVYTSKRASADIIWAAITFSHVVIFLGKGRSAHKFWVKAAGWPWRTFRHLTAVHPLHQNHGKIGVPIPLSKTSSTFLHYAVITISLLIWSNGLTTQRCLLSNALAW